MAIEEQYSVGDFSDTASERLHNEALNDERKYRFNKTVNRYRVQNDLTTVKESLEGDSVTQIFTDSLNPPFLSTGKRWNQSFKASTRLSRLDDADKARQNHGDLYHSFNLK